MLINPEPIAGPFTRSLIETVPKPCRYLSAFGKFVAIGVNMKRHFAIGLLAGIIGAAILLLLATRAGSVGAHSQSDLTNTPPGSLTASMSAPFRKPANSSAVSPT